MEMFVVVMETFVVVMETFDVVLETLVVVMETFVIVMETLVIVRRGVQRSLRGILWTEHRYGDFGLSDVGQSHATRFLSVRHHNRRGRLSCSGLRAVDEQNSRICRFTLSDLIC